MANIVLMRVGGGLVAADNQSAEIVAKMKIGAGVQCEIKRHNNPDFHRKMFALLNLAFESWDPGQREYRGAVVNKNFDQFRRDITILAGFYDSVITLRGEVRLTAKSLNFSSMGQEEREQLYSKIIDVVLSKILTQYTRADLDNVVNQILGFL